MLLQLLCFRLQPSTTTHYLQSQHVWFLCFRFTGFYYVCKKWVLMRWADAFWNATILQSGWLPAPAFSAPVRVLQCKKFNIFLPEMARSSIFSCFANIYDDALPKLATKSTLIHAARIRKAVLRIIRDVHKFSKYIIRPAMASCS